MRWEAVFHLDAAASSAFPAIRLGDPTVLGLTFDGRVEVRTSQTFVTLVAGFTVWALATDRERWADRSRGGEVEDAPAQIVAESPTEEVVIVSTA